MQGISILIASIYLSPGVDTLFVPAEDQKISLSYTEPGKTRCPQARLRAYCCDSLDYSGLQVECVGPGLVDYFEQCLKYHPRPMCCCAIEPETIPGIPEWVPRQISCDKDCNILSPDDDSATLEL